jgi:hypothetical protein
MPPKTAASAVLLRSAVRLLADPPGDVAAGTFNQGDVIGQVQDRTGRE